MHHKRCIATPFTIRTLDADIKRKVSAYVLNSQLMPLLFIKLSSLATCLHTTLFRACHFDKHLLCIRIIDIKIHGGNLCRYSHIAIIGEYIGAFSRRSHFRRSSR